ELFGRPRSGEPDCRPGQRVRRTQHVCSTSPCGRAESHPSRALDRAPAGCTACRVAHIGRFGPLWRAETDEWLYGSAARQQTVIVAAVECDPGPWEVRGPAVVDPQPHAG